MTLHHVEFGFETESKGDTPALVAQVHGATLHTIDSSAQWQALRETAPEGDGVLTSVVELPIYIFTADCVPVLLFTENPDAPIAAVHSGWRGAAAGIAKKAYDRLAPFGSVHVIIGPCIHGSNYEVKQDFVESFEKSDPNIRDHLIHKSGKMFFDVARYVLATQLAAIPEPNRHLEHMRCTYASDLPSYRRNGNTQVRIRSWIQKTV